jgi:6-phosphogluconolactonase/glucosamine-6-phosphate isomerase/deaminase
MTNAEETTRAIARGIDRALASGMKVLWLLSGGSNIDIELEVLNQLQHATPQNLTVSLIDERFVVLDNPDSNWHQLTTRGLDDQRARLVAPIVNPELDLLAAAHDFGERLGVEVAQADVVIGQFGIGADGHTAGILPHSIGVHEDHSLVVGYEGPDFQRITTTPALFRQLNLAIAVAMGQDKLDALQKLNGDASDDDVPARLLLLAKDLIVYTDQEVK